MWLSAESRRLWDYVRLGALVTLSVAIQIGCGNRETILFIEKPTEVHSIKQISSSTESSDLGFEPGRVIAVLKPGETAKAVGVYHGKDYDAFQVKLADGTEGLVVAGDTFRVTSR